LSHRFFKSAHEMRALALPQAVPMPDPEKTVGPTHLIEALLIQ
jgi:hypothetical protein